MVLFNTDHYFFIGHSHLNSGKPCQDYALSGECGGAAFAIIADGCSTGGNTDIGSRIISLATASVIKDHWMVNKDTVGKEISSEIAFKQKIAISGIRSTLDLRSKDMFSTCVYAYLSDKGGLVHIQGDGVVAIKYRSGSISIIKTEWQKNMPFYPSYAESDMGGFIMKHGGDLNADAVKKTTCLIGGKDVLKEETSDFTLKQGIAGTVIKLERAEDIDFVAVFSDGIAQIDDVDWIEATLLMIAFKNFAGEFLKRRMIRGIKDFQADGKKGPLDDISCAIIRVTLEEGDEADGNKG